MSEKYSEDLFRVNFKDWFKALYPGSHLQNIESRSTGNGIPDTNLCKGGREIWVELKSGHLSTSSIKPGQYIWHIKRNQAGGTTWIVQRYDLGIIKVYSGKRIREFRVKPNSVIPCAMFDGNTKEGRRDLFEFLFN